MNDWHSWVAIVVFVGAYALIISEKVHRVAVALGGAGLMLAIGATDDVSASAVLTGVVDNIPYVATMAPITGDLVQNTGGDDHVMWWALALGADLGGNATAIGASANVVVLGIAERNRQPISFWQFTKYGLIVTAVTVVIALGYVWLRYFALA